MSEPSYRLLPRSTPLWLRALLCAVEVELELEATRGASNYTERDDEIEEWAAARRGEAHQRLRDVLYGPP